MKHVGLAAGVAVAGLVFTSRTWLGLVNTLGPEAGLIVKNFIILFVIYLLHFVDGLIGQPHQQALGFLLVYVSFSMIFNYQSEWITDSDAENVERQTPDGAVYHRVRNLGLNPDSARIVTFVIVPFVLFLVGSQFIKRGKLNLE